MLAQTGSVGINGVPYRVVGDLRALILVHAHNVPKAGIKEEDQKTEEEHGQQATSSDDMQPRGMIVVAAFESGSVKNDLIHEERQQCHWGDVLQWDIEG
jgi:hypothetical protein